jgi:IS5 family transposase
VVDRSTQKIICVHVARSSCVHDYKVWQQSRVVLQPPTQLLADSGYQGIQATHHHTTLPKKKSKHHPLTKQDKHDNKQQASDRVLVEHTNRSLKRFRILSERYRNRRKRFGLRINLIAAILNFYH